MDRRKMQVGQLYVASIVHQMHYLCGRHGSGLMFCFYVCAAYFEYLQPLAVVLFHTDFFKLFGDHTDHICSLSLAMALVN